MPVDRAVLFRLRTVLVEAILPEPAFAVEDLVQCPGALQAASAGIAEAPPNTTAATRPVISRFFISFPSISSNDSSMTGKNGPIIFIRLSPFE
ncbi:hypothetical protein [Aestuariivirga sp.]|uniref:hypothetical protein n=1 Tax=Aestuariivirga sp. TaxID=2650926 RepID=UPI0037841A92